MQKKRGQNSSLVSPRQTQSQHRCGWKCHKQQQCLDLVFLGSQKKIASKFNLMQDVLLLGGAQECAPSAMNHIPCFVPLCRYARQSSAALDFRVWLRLSHALVHEGPEADWRGGDAHGVDEAAGEEAAEDGSEVGVGNLEQSSSAFPHSMR